MATPTERINIAVNLSGLGQNASSSVSAVTRQTTVGTSVIQGSKGDPGEQGEPGPGIASGGTSGQILQKNSGTDFDTSWHTLVKDDVGLSNVDNTSDSTKNSAVATLINKDMTSGTNTFPTFNQNTTGSAAKLTTGRTIGISGDLTYTSPSFDGSTNVTGVGTLATVNSNTGSFGTATQVPSVTVNGKGLITAASNTTIQIAESQVTNLTSDLAGKQGTLSLTTTGTSGASTLVGNTLNIPQYSGGGGSGDVVGPSSSRDNEVPRFDGTTGKLIIGGATYPVTIDDDGTLTVSKGWITSGIDASTSESIELQIFSGGPILANGNTGGVEIYATDPNGSGDSGSVRVHGGNADGGGVGGEVRIYAGRSSGANSGPDIALSAGSSGSGVGATGDGGNASLSAGNGRGIGGYVDISAGNAWSGSGGDGGDVYIYAGSGDGAGADGKMILGNPGYVWIQKNNGSFNAALNVDAITADRTYTFPNADTNIMGDGTTNTVTNKDLTSGTNTFPTFNQNTTGSAGTLTTARTIGTLTGDVTSAGSSFNGSANNTNATTLATVNSNVGSFTNANITVDAKGRITAASNGSGGGSGITRNISTITTSVTIGATSLTDYVVFVGSGGAPTLPTAVSNTNMYTIKNIHTTNKTISTTSSQTIDGSTTATIIPNQSLEVVSDGSNWRII